MSSERLATLLRQRQQMTEHLAWLDSEIAAAVATGPGNSSAIVTPPASQPAPPPAAAPASTPPALPTSTPVTAPAASGLPAGPEFAGKLIEADPEALARANALADSVLESYRAQSADTPQATRRSCLLLIVAFTLFCTAAVMGIYYFYYR